MRQKGNITSWVLVGLIIVTGVLSLGQVVAAMEGHGFWLVSPEEASMAPAVGSKDRNGAFRLGSPLPNAGPIVKVESPAVHAEAISPVEIMVRFSPRKAPVDLSSLEVTLVKFFSIDITDRIVPYATSKGIHIQEANLPSGEHLIRLAVSDKDGKLTVKELTVRVL